MPRALLPGITVVTASYNAAATIEETLRSVREHLRDHSLRYDTETDAPPRPLAPGPADPATHR